MKKIVFLFVILIFLSGCESNKSVVCNKPYIQVGMECCLDQNSNDICDKDESNLVQVTPTKTTSKEIWGVCYLPGNKPGIPELGCRNLKIFGNTIKLIIHSQVKEIRAIKEIRFPNIGSKGCSKTFDTSFNNSLKYEDEKEFNVECEFSDEALYSDMIITYYSYKEDGKFISDEEQFYTSDVKGYIEETVQ